MPKMSKRVAKEPVKASKKEDKLQQKKELDRLTVVEKELEVLMNQPYVDGTAIHRLKFDPEQDEEVIFLFHGMFLRGRIVYFFRLAPSLYVLKPGADTRDDVKYRILTYTILPNGATPGNEVVIPENELVGSSGNEAVDVFGKLYAHFWNQHQRKWLCQEQLEIVGEDIWSLDEEDIKKASDEWKESFGKPCSFAEYCHPDYSPDKYGQLAAPAPGSSNLDVVDDLAK